MTWKCGLKGGAGLRRRFFRTGCLLLLLPVGELAPLGPPPPTEGIRVQGPLGGDEFFDLSSLHRGDTLLSWKKLDPKEPRHVVGQGRLNNPFDFVYMLSSQELEGAVVLRGLRDGKLREWLFRTLGLPINFSPAGLAPRLEGFPRARYRLAMSSVGVKRYEAIFDLANALEAADPRSAIWLRLQIPRPRPSNLFYQTLIERASRLSPTEALNINDQVAFELLESHALVTSFDDILGFEASHFSAALKAKRIAKPEGTPREDAFYDILRFLSPIAHESDAAREKKPSIDLLQTGYGKQINLDLRLIAEARQALDPGTIGLSYWPTSRKTQILAFRPASSPGKGWEIFDCASSAAKLSSELLRHQDSVRGSRLRLTSREDSARLYDLLLRPAQSFIDTADRLAIYAPGPLQDVPFSALIHGGRFLAEEKSVYRAQSLDDLVQLKKRRPRARQEPAGWKILAFGDPAYKSLEGHGNDYNRDSALSRAIDRGLSLEPIPGTRAEIETIVRLFPTTRALLGPAASEANAREAASEADVLHFACHGLHNPESPPESGLALATPPTLIPGWDNGLLQAWEVRRRLKLKAELVTLSACNTGLGDESGRKDRFGLSSAFLAAGARSVLASTWSVSDEQTSVLMGRFYRYLRAGLAKDEALRRAQVDMIRSGSPSLAAPAAWAGFELFGDWQ